MKKIIGLVVMTLLLCSFGIIIAADDASQTIDTSPPITFCPPAATQIRIYDGLNFITMPVIPDSNYTVEQFVKDIEGGISILPLENPGTKPAELEQIAVKKYWKVWRVYTYKNGAYKQLYPNRLEYNIGRSASLPSPFNKINHNMVPGEAYFVHAKYSGPMPAGGVDYLGFRQYKDVAVPGQIPYVPISLHLDKGWNRVGVAPGSNNPISLNGLMADLLKQNLKANKIFLWSAANQKWEKYDLNIPIPYPCNDTVYGQNTQSDRKIRLDEAIMVYCEENGLYIPKLNEIREPERVNYMGHVYYTLGIPDGRALPYDMELHTTDGKIVPLKAADEYIRIQLEDVASDPYLDVLPPRVTVEGVMETMKASNELTGEEWEVRVLLVDKVTEVKRVEHTGKIHMIMTIAQFAAEPRPLYNLVMHTDTGEDIPLVPADDVINGMLMKAADSGLRCTVFGYMKAVKEGIEVMMVEDMKYEEPVRVTYTGNLEHAPECVRSDSCDGNLSCCKYVLITDSGSKKVPVCAANEDTERMLNRIATLFTPGANKCTVEGIIEKMNVPDCTTGKCTGECMEVEMLKADKVTIPEYGRVSYTGKVEEHAYTAQEPYEFTLTVSERDANILLRADARIKDILFYAMHSGFYPGAPVTVSGVEVVLVVSDAAGSVNIPVVIVDEAKPSMPPPPLTEIIQMRIGLGNCIVASSIKDLLAQLGITEYREFTQGSMIITVALKSNEDAARLHDDLLKEGIESVITLKTDITSQVSLSLTAADVYFMSIDLERGIELLRRFAEQGSIKIVSIEKIRCVYSTVIVNGIDEEKAKQAKISLEKSEYVRLVEIRKLAAAMQGI